MKGHRSLGRALALTCAVAALAPAVASAAESGTASCPPGTRAVQGVGTGCTTSPDNKSDSVATIAAILFTGAGAVAIVRDVRAQAGRRRRRPSTQTALSERG
jgi:hypothetical protein